MNEIVREALSGPPHTPSPSSQPPASFGGWSPPKRSEGFFRFPY